MAAFAYHGPWQWRSYILDEEDRGSASLEHGQVSAETGSQVSAERARGRAIADEK